MSSDRETTLRDAVIAFLAKWPDAKKAIDSVCLIAHVHGAGYSGPTLGVEIEAMQAALASTPPASVPGDRRAARQGAAVHERAHRTVAGTHHLARAACRRAAGPSAQHIMDRFALLTDCTPLDEKAATVLQARINELQQAIAALSSTSTPEPQTQHWAVEVRRNGENLVTIESNCLSGKPEFREIEADVIRQCADHLHAFIGPRSTPEPQTVCEWKDKYHELLFAVGSKWPGETRHQTALRYIRERETPSGQAASTAPLSLSPEPSPQEPQS